MSMWSETQNSGGNEMAKSAKKGKLTSKKLEKKAPLVKFHPRG